MKVALFSWHRYILLHRPANVPTLPVSLSDLKFLFTVGRQGQCIFIDASGGHLKLPHLKLYKTEVFSHDLILMQH